MSDCCGCCETTKKSKPEKARQTEAREGTNKESFLKKLLSSLGLKSEDEK